MGVIVAFSAYESHRKSHAQLPDEARTGQVFLFTGVRYERITSGEPVSKKPMPSVDNAMVVKRVPVLK